MEESDRLTRLEVVQEHHARELKEIRNLRWWIVGSSFGLLFALGSLLAAQTAWVTHCNQLALDKTTAAIARASSELRAEQQKQCADWQNRDEAKWKDWLARDEAKWNTWKAEWDKQWKAWQANQDKQWKAWLAHQDKQWKAWLAKDEAKWNRWKAEWDAERAAWKVDQKRQDAIIHELQSPQAP